MTNFKKKTSKRFHFFFAILFFGILLSIISQTSSLYQVIVLKQNSTFSKAASNSFEDFREHAWIWVDHSGWINARAEMESKDLGFGQQNLNLFIASYSDIYEIFDHANWWFRSTDNPSDKNAELNVQFRTNDAGIAQNYANLIVEYMSRDLIISFEFEGVSAYQDWRDNQWIDLTSVHYRAHIDWPWFTDFINDTVIPRNVGGLAETINVTNANNINAWAWPSGPIDQPEVTFAFGFEFNSNNIYDVSGLYSGFHTLEINKLIHTKKIQKTNNQDHLWVDIEFPDVQSLMQNPTTNNSECTIFKDYHAPPEPWVKNHYWNVNFQIFSGVYTDLSVNFTYNFIPWFLETRTETSLIINHYGYLFKGINLRGNYTKIIDYSNTTSVPNWDPNIVALEMSFRPTREGMWNNFELGISYPDVTDHYVDANSLALDIANILGITYNNNHSHDFSMDWERLHYEGITYRFQSDNFTHSISQNLLNNTEIIQSTPVFENQNLSAINEYRQWSVYHKEVDQWINETDFEWNPLAEEESNPIKNYSGAQTDLTIDLLSDWGWTSIPFCQNYSVSRFEICFPQNDSYGYSPYQKENNGWGWQINTWNDYWQDFSYVNHNLEVFTESSSLQFTNNNNQPNGTIFDEFGVTFDYSFYDNSQDINPPEASIYYLNESTNEEYWQEWDINNMGITFSGIDDHLHVRVRDDNSHGIYRWWWPFYYTFWNSTSVQWESKPRFGISGIYNTTLEAYFSDLPANCEELRRKIQITTNWNNGVEIDYNVTWDTLDDFADGKWTLIAQTEDNNGYSGENGFHNLLVDNYDDATYTEGPQVNILSSKNVSVSGTHTVQVQVTDDIDVFTVVLTKDFSGWILNDTNNDDIYEFNWNTLGESEDSIHYFTIITWDIEGHKIIYDFWLMVDNYGPGNPPTIEFVSPSSENAVITGDYLFEVNATDDQKIISVRMKIDSGASLTMNYNNNTGYYDRSYNVSQLTNGYHLLSITITDIDDNQHTVTDTIGFTVTDGQETALVSDPPLWNSDRSELPENISEYVKNGNFLDYEAESGEISFKIAAKDDNAIAAVEFQIFSIENFDPSTGEPTMDDLRKESSTDMYQSGSDGDWDLYEYVWNSTSSSDNYYMCQIDIQDNDEVANHLIISIILEIDNIIDEEPPKIGAPGFEALVLLLSLISWITTKSHLKRRKKKG